MLKKIKLVILVILLPLCCQAIALEKMTKFEFLNGIPDAEKTTHPAFAKILLGLSAPITYQAQVEKDIDYIVVIASADSYWDEPAKRIMQAVVEGAELVTFDPTADVGENKPLILIIQAKDTNDDNWLDIKAQAAPNSPDKNPNISAVWVFEKKIWQENNLNKEIILTGQADSKALYFVNCGTENSELIKLSDNANLNELKTKVDQLNNISDLSKDSILLKDICPDFNAITKEFQNIQQLYQQKKLTELKEKISSLNKKLGSANDQFLAKLNDKLSPTPIYTKPTRTILISPYMAMATIEQHDKLTLDVMNHPMPSSQNAKYHGWQNYGKQDILGKIEISTDSLLQKVSTALELDYNLSLTSIDYDPLITSARYLDGAVDFQILDGSGILISSKGYPMKIDFDKTGSEFKQGFWYKSKSTGDIKIFCGIAFDAESAACNNCVIFWAEALEQLIEKSTYFTDFKKVKNQTAKWTQTQTENFKLQGNLPSLIRQVEMSKRVLLSMQFVSGGIYAAPDNGYDAIWVRDTANAVVLPALCGDLQYLKRWTPYLMNNPTTIDWKGKKYKSFLQFVPSDQQQCWQQDGTFYSILSAYSYWKLTADDSQLEKWYSLCKGAIEFINASAYDAELGLYYEWYINEAPMKIAHDWENATNWNPYIKAMKIDGRWPMYMYTIYINNNLYNSFIMLAEMAEELKLEDEKEQFMQQADKLAKSINRHLYDNDNSRYIPGIAQMEDGGKIPVDWNYWDIYFDYVWAFTLHPQSADPQKAFASLDNMLNNRNGIFPGLDKKLYFSPARPHASYVYSAMGQFDKAQICLQRVTERAEDINLDQPHDVIYTMKGAIPERVDTIAGHRPQTFTAGPYLYGAASLAFIMDYHGITLCPSGYITKAENICMRDSVFSIDPTYSRNTSGLIFDNTKIPHTLKLPSKYNKPGKHSISILDTEKPIRPLLKYTCFKLIDIKMKSKSVIYSLKGLGNGILRFDSSVSKDCVSIKNGDNDMDFAFWKDGNSSFIQVNSKGKFTAAIKRN